MQAPDELNHFLRAYQVSEGQFLPEKADRRLGGRIPLCLEQFNFLYTPCSNLPGYKAGTTEMLEGFNVKFSNEERYFVDFPNTAYYSPVTYLPQSFALLVLRQFKCSVGTLYHGSRLFSYALWVLSMFFVIRLLPFYKWLFTLLILLPMHVYISSCFSADSVTNILCLLLIAFILNKSFSPGTLSRKDLILLLILGILLALTKIVYTGLLLLIFIIPAEKFGSKRNKFLLSGLIFLISFTVALTWSSVVMQFYIPFEDYHEGLRQFTTLHAEANYYRQKEYLMQHPLHFFKVVFNSLFHESFYLSSYVGQFGMYADTSFPPWLFISTFIVIVFVALSELTNQALSFSKKTILFLSAITTYSLIILSQHLTWNKVGNDSVTAFQGRYLVPVFPLIFMLFNNTWLKIKFNVGNLVIPFVIFSNIYCCNMLYTRFISGSSNEETEFYTSMEKFNVNGMLETSEPSKLVNAPGRTDKEHKSGKYAIALPPDSSKLYLYKVKNPGQGDFVEICIWLKGRGGEMDVSGIDENCSVQKFKNQDIEVASNNGWKKSRLIVSFLNTCSNSEVGFYISNPSGDTLYFDDLHCRSVKLNP